MDMAAGGVAAGMDNTPTAVSGLTAEQDFPRLVTVERRARGNHFT
jgi:hypothetical protein